MDRELFLSAIELNLSKETLDLQCISLTFLGIFVSRIVI